MPNKYKSMRTLQQTLKDKKRAAEQFKQYCDANEIAHDRIIAVPIFGTGGNVFCFIALKSEYVSGLGVVQKNVCKMYADISKEQIKFTEYTDITR